METKDEGTGTGLFEIRAKTIRARGARLAGPLVLAALVVGGCQSSAGDAPSAALDSMRAALTVSGGYLQPTFFQPKAGYVATDLFDINSGGTVVGYSSATYGPYPGGQAAEPFIADRGAAATQLANPWPNGGEAYAVAINDQGYASGYGGPQNFTYNITYHNPVLYHPDHTFELPALPSATTGGLYPTNSYGPTTRSPDLVGAAQVYDPGALAVWHLDGNAQDVLGHSSLSTPSASSFVPGRYGQAVAFGGSTCLQATETSDSQVANAAGVTMMAWVKPDATMCPGGTRIVVQRGWDYTLALTCNAAGHAALTHYFYANEPGFSAPVGDLPFGQWSHVAVSWDRMKVRSYINGAVAATTNLAGTQIASTGTWISIGCNPPVQTVSFLGSIDEVALFRHPMGADQISRYMNNHGDYRPAPSLLYGAHWQWARYIDGFFDVIATPPGAAYSGWSYSAGSSPSGKLFGTEPLANGSTAGVIYAGDTGMQNANDLLPAGSDWQIQAVNGINAAGIAIGSGLYKGQHAIFKMDLASHAMTNLGPYPRAPYNNPSYNLSAARINAAGHIVANVYDGTNTVSVRPLLYTPELGLIDLNDVIDPASGWTLAHVAAINDADEIVGYGYNAAAPDARRAFRVKLPSLGAAGCFGQPDGTTCEDGNLCTKGDKCLAGACKSGGLLACSATTCQVAGQCDLTTGTCPAPTPRPDGTTCDDSDPCTSGDICQAGACQSNVRCLSADPCQTGTCDVANHKCVFAPTPAGRSCSDGKACSADDRCDGAGTCFSGPQLPTSCAPPDSTHAPGVCDDTQAAAPPVTGLEARWRLEGDGLDAGGGGHTLLAAPGVVFAGGKVGKGLSLDGGSACMSAPAWSSAAMTGAPGVSLMAWVKLPAGFQCPPPGPTGAELTTVVASKGSDYAIGVMCNGGTPLAAALRLPTGGAGPQWLAGQPVSSNAWHLIAATWDPTGQTVYTDGVPTPKFSSPVTAVTNGDTRVAVGCPVAGHPSGASAFAGTVDEVSLYRRTLTAAEVAQYYGASTQLTCTYPPIPPEIVACAGQPDGTACTPGRCPSNNVCYQGVCGGAGVLPTGQATACLNLTGVVDLGAGATLALIGYQSTTGTNASSQNVWIDQPGQITPIDAPPPVGAPGSDPGFYQPILNELQTLTWTVGGQRIVVNGQSTPRLTAVQTPNPYGPPQYDHVVVNVKVGTTTTQQTVHLRSDVVGCVGQSPGDLCSGPETCSLDHRCGYGVVLNRSAWTATSTMSGSAPGLAIDANTSTSWSSSGPTSSTDWFKVDMATRQTFNRIVIDAGPVQTSFLQVYDVWAFDYPGAQSHLIATGTTTSPYLEIRLPPTPAQILQIIPRGWGQPWTIREVRVANDN